MIALSVHIAIGEYRMMLNRIALSVHIAIGEYRMTSKHDSVISSYSNR